MLSLGSHCMLIFLMLLLKFHWIKRYKLVRKREVCIRKWGIDWFMWQCFWCKTYQLLISEKEIAYSCACFNNFFREIKEFRSLCMYDISVAYWLWPSFPLFLVFGRSSVSCSSWRNRWRNSGRRSSVQDLSGRVRRRKYTENGVQLQRGSQACSWNVCH